MDSSSKLNSSNTTKPMGEIVSSNTSNINNINNNMNINIGGSSSSNSRMRSKEMENLSFEISKYPRDLLQRFLGGGGGNSSQQSRRISSVDDSIIGGNEEEDDEDDEGGLNLGLGLSLGGKFGVDKSNKGLLIRSSSIAGTMPLFREQDDGTVVVAPPPLQPPCRGGGGGGGGGGGLVRTSSLPVETEEEWRKRKEMQTLRRMEAKRRRSEKQRGLKDGGGGGNGGGSGCGEEKGGVEGLKFRGRLEREQQSLGITSKFIGSSMGNLFGSSTPPQPPPSSNVEVKGRRTTFGSLQGFLIAQGHAPGSGSGSGLGQSQGQGQGQGQQGSSQGSGESQGGTSSGASELESKTHQASSSCGEARSPASTQSLQERPSQDSLGSPGALKGGGDTSQREERGPETESSSKQPKASSGIEDMPCVFTIGDGPNGRKVEGILYRYGKGEQVRIMCVCHGTFLSPRDFVKHAGGRDVEHPLRHIVVSPSSSAFQ